MNFPSHLSASCGSNHPTTSPVPSPVNFGYTGSVMANIRRAAPSVHYKLPDMGYVDTGGETMLSNGFDLGLEFVHSIGCLTPYT